MSTVLKRPTVHIPTLDAPSVVGRAIHRDPSASSPIHQRGSTPATNPRQARSRSPVPVSQRPAWGANSSTPRKGSIPRTTTVDDEVKMCHTASKVVQHPSPRPIGSFAKGTVSSSTRRVGPPSTFSRQNSAKSVVSDKAAPSPLSKNISARPSVDARVSELEESNRALRGLLESTMRELQSFKDTYHSERAETLAELHALREKVLIQSMREPSHKPASVPVHTDAIHCFEPMVERCLDLNIE